MLTLAPRHLPFREEKKAACPLGCQEYNIRSGSGATQRQFALGARPLNHLQRGVYAVG